MRDGSAITIPPDLLPSDGRFGSGPSRVPVDTLVDLAATGTDYMGTSHRKATVKDVVADIRSGLAELYSLPAGYEVVLGVGGATAFWDAAAFGLIDERSAHFTCGEFSGKFAAVTRGAPHLADPVVIDVEPGWAPDPEPVDGVDTTAFVHNETSTGVRATYRRFGHELVLVDATSAAGAVTIDLAESDAYYFSPQKALASEGGLWVALMSPEAIERAHRIEASGRWVPPFLSLVAAIDNSLKDQTSNTPALATLFLLRARIRNLAEEGGIAAAEAIATASSDHLYGWAEASSYARPFVSEPRFRSTTVVTIDLDDDVPAEDVNLHLRANGIVDTDSYRKLGRNQLRIATFPTIPTSDVVALAACIDHVVSVM
jgi:phosphoserine aminotransferase